MNLALAWGFVRTGAIFRGSLLATLALLLYAALLARLLLFVGLGAFLVLIGVLVLIRHLVLLSASGIPLLRWLVPSGQDRNAGCVRPTWCKRETIKRRGIAFGTKFAPPCL